MEQKMLIAAFKDPVLADQAVDELESLGYAPKDLSVITKHSETGDDIGRNAADGALTGATTGGVIGGLAGLQAGAGDFPALAG
jgi:hypothetical protein